MMGGAVAYMIAVTAPERTRSLVLVAAGGLGQEVAFYLRACTLPGMSLLARLPRPKNAARDALRSCFYDAGRIPEEFYQEAVRYGNASFSEFIRAISAGVNIRGVRRPLREAWVARASRYVGPALAVWGREDYVLPVKHVQDVQRILPQAKAHVIERCGHLVMFERPDEFLAATLPFLDRAEQAEAA